MAWSDLLPFLVLGLLGSLHCVGMCGGFAIAVTSGADGKRDVFTRQLLYVLGKALSYGIVALCLANAASWLGEDAGQHTHLTVFSTLQLVLGLAAGCVLIAMGWSSLGLGGIVGGRWFAPGSKWIRPLRSMLAGVRALPGFSGAFGTGVVNGVLPCGLSWSAFLLATQYPPQTAFVGALLFGLSTAPILIAVGAAPRLVPVELRRRARPLLGAALVVFGVLTIVRSAGQEPGTIEPGAPCCVELAER